MGLMDKARAQASTLAQQAKETATAGKAKLDQSQAGRRSDGLLRSLGLAVLAERTGRATSETSAQINQLLSDLAAHEQQSGINLVQQAAQVQAQHLANQMRPGDFLTSSDSTLDPNVSAAPAGGAPSYGGAPSFGSAPASFPQAGGPTGFPDAGQAASFPGAAPAGFPAAAPGSAAPSGFPAAAPTGFPEATPATSFPGAAPTGFPGAPATPAQEAPPEPDPAPTGFPETGGASGFPPASGV